MKTQSKPNKSNRRGTTTVELAIILPVLVVLTFGALKYGLLFLRAQQVTNVARQACRLAIRPYATNAMVENEIDRLMTAIGLDDTGYSVVMPAVDSLVTAEELTLEITVPTEKIDKLTLPIWLPLPDNIIAEVSMSKEGPGT
ncbi:MAG: pilus assembly protein [Planctomycetales bacterium]|nr:pilus assembly protein [Planctomycetales bacterium]